MEDQRRYTVRLGGFGSLHGGARNNPRLMVRGAWEAWEVWEAWEEGGVQQAVGPSLVHLLKKEMPSRVIGTTATLSLSICGDLLLPHLKFNVGVYTLEIVD